MSGFKDVVGHTEIIEYMKNDRFFMFIKTTIF